MSRKPFFEPPPGLLLPNCEPLPGAVVAQYRKRDGKTFGPYWFRVWRGEDGRQRKAYVPARDLAAVRDACRAHKERAKSPKERARELATWRRAQEREWRDFVFLIECSQRIAKGQPLHYTQERRARRIMGLGTD